MSDVIGRSIEWYCGSIFSSEKTQRWIEENNAGTREILD